ncbi:MAG: ribosomal protein [Verrucomicrobiota bacterium]|jgi:large subunit ribosomal protein L18
MSINTKKMARLKRHWHIRKNVSGISSKPRLSVFRSLNNIYAQLIDDTSGKTLASASTLEKAFKAAGKGAGNKEGAALVGKLVAERGLKAGVKAVVFDRGGFKYHGRVQSLADAAREAGLEF